MCQLLLKDDLIPYIVVLLLLRYDLSTRGRLFIIPILLLLLLFLLQLKVFLHDCHSESIDLLVADLRQLIDFSEDFGAFDSGALWELRW